MKLLKSVYGLTTAPIARFSKVNEVLKEMGFSQCFSDPYTWSVVEKDESLG